MRGAGRHASVNKQGCTVRGNFKPDERVGQKQAQVQGAAPEPEAFKGSNYGTHTKIGASKYSKHKPQQQINYSSLLMLWLTNAVVDRHYATTTMLLKHNNNHNYTWVLSACCKEANCAAATLSGSWYLLRRRC